MDRHEPMSRQAAELMTRFAERTGLVSGRPPRRYLWTDAFAVCNALALARRTGSDQWNERALQLVDQVHRILGRQRPDGRLVGALSGLVGRDAEEHPTSGGLRIGKRLPERGALEPYDERLEWDRDGQYFHYLTKWMHALDQVAGATGELRFHRWARELALAAHAAFVRGPPGARRMSWKMSTDLSRALVPSMGQHDPLDGLVTCLQLESSPLARGSEACLPSLAPAREEFGALLERTELRTADPLGLGGLLADAFRLAQVLERGHPEWAALLESLLAAALESLTHYERLHAGRLPASQRLAFRELGLALGLAAVESLSERMRSDTQGILRRARVTGAVEGLLALAPIGRAITSYWLDPGHRQDRSWTEHADINEVMLATCLVPEGFLVLRPEPATARESARAARPRNDPRLSSQVPPSKETSP